MTGKIGCSLSSVHTEEEGPFDTRDGRIPCHCETLEYVILFDHFLLKKADRSFDHYSFAALNPYPLVTIIPFKTFKPDTITKHLSAEIPILTSMPLRAPPVSV